MFDHKSCSEMSHQITFLLLLLEAITGIFMRNALSIPAYKVHFIRNTLAFQIIGENVD